MPTLMHRLQARYDAMEHPAYYADEPEYLPKQCDCVKCGLDKSYFTDECHNGIDWICPDCGKEQDE